MRLVAVYDDSDMLGYDFGMVWLGEGDPVPNIRDPGWVCFVDLWIGFGHVEPLEHYFNYPYKELYGMQINHRECFIIDVSIEELLTHNSERIRQWAVKQVGKT